MRLSGIFDDPALTEKLPQALLETLTMVGWSSLLTVLLGVPLGMLLNLVSPIGLRPNRIVYQALSAIVSIGISLPFVMLVTLVLPVVRLIFGSATGWQATILPLTLAAFPFLARLVEISLRTVPEGKIESALMVGATPRQIAWGVQIRESRSLLVADVTVTVISIVSCSALVGVVGGGGLGYLAISYGYNRFQTDVMIVTLLVIVALVEVIHIVGEKLAAGLRPQSRSARVPRTRLRKLEKTA